MAKKNAEDFLVAGGGDHALRARFDAIKGMEDFVAAANAEGYDFTIEEFKEVLREAGDSFDLIGNPAKRQIWWV